MFGTSKGLHALVDRVAKLEYANKELRAQISMLREQQTHASQILIERECTGGLPHFGGTYKAVPLTEVVDMLSRKLRWRAGTDAKLVKQGNKKNRKPFR